MKYTKLFNNHEEYLAYTASTSFNVPNVSWCKLEEEAHCTPPNICQEEHEYALYGEPSYPSTVEADETMFTIEYEYSDKELEEQFGKLYTGLKTTDSSTTRRLKFNPPKCEKGNKSSPLKLLKMPSASFKELYSCVNALKFGSAFVT